MAAGLVNGSFIRYTFYIPGVTDWSEYRYQKLFRMLYGYVQVVSKGSGASYNYYREGVLTDIPYLKTGKNSIIVPQDSLQKILIFFRTGKAASGDRVPEGCKVPITHFIETVQRPAKELVPAFDALLERLKLSDGASVDSALADLVQAQDWENKNSAQVLAYAQGICSSSWFNAVAGESPRMKKFQDNYYKLKEKSSPSRQPQAVVLKP